MARNLTTGLQRGLRQSIAGGLGAGDIFSTASLDLNFARHKSLDSRITFSRASSGTYVDAAGVIRTAGNNVARFDHNPTTGESLGLLVEESRTNLLEYSETITSWSQTVGGGVVLTANSASDPAGGSTATLIENDGVAGFVGDATSWALNTTYTISGYLKAGTGDKASILLYSAGGNSGNWNNETSNVAVTFDLTNGTSEAFSGAVAPTSSSITDAGNGWWRCSITATCTGANTNSQQLIRNVSGVTDGIYAWGFQIEAGSFPTSYIRTEGSTVTRSADVASITGTNFSSWYNQTEGTVFSASRHKAVTARTLAFTDGTASNAMQQYLLASTAAMDSYVSGTWQGSGSASTTFTSNQQFKVISTIQTNSGVTAVDGTLGTVDTSYGIPTVDRLLIGQSRSSDNTNGTIARLTYWPTRLSNDTLQTITR